MTERYFQVNLNGRTESLKDPKVSQEYFKITQYKLPKTRV